MFKYIIILDSYLQSTKQTKKQLIWSHSADTRSERILTHTHTHTHTELHLYHAPVLLLIGECVCVLCDVCNCNCTYMCILDVAVTPMTGLYTTRFHSQFDIADQSKKIARWGAPVWSSNAGGSASPHNCVPAFTIQSCDIQIYSSQTPLAFSSGALVMRVVRQVVLSHWPMRSRHRHIVCANPAPRSPRRQAPSSYRKACLERRHRGLCGGLQSPQEQYAGSKWNWIEYDEQTCNHVVTSVSCELACKITFWKVVLCLA